MRRILTGLGFYLGFAPSFSRLGFERRGLDRQPVKADFSGQRWLVTGASSGIGREIALQAARRGARVTAVARSDSRLEAMRSITSGAIEALVADLSLMRGVRAATAELAERLDGIDVLVNNVGVLLNSFSTTDEGFETSFATNLLGHYLLTELLVEQALLRSGGIVISMSSGGMYTEPLAPESLNVTDPKLHDGVAAYARHKRAQVELTHYWNQQHGPEADFHVMHPGWVDTEGVRSSLPGFRQLFRPLLRTPEQGADTAIWLAAERPEPLAEGVWFDREPQPEHMTGATRTDPALRGELVASLEAGVRACQPADELNLER
jgi:NAD(P)-dependent dehydrogenase (short-subunit alcohol dehydrogenase family)